MHIMQMLGIVTIVFFTTLALIALNRDKINIRIGNAIFVTVDIILYAFWMYGIYMGGSKITLSILIGNISPLACVILAMTPLFSDKIKSMAYSAIAFLNFGLFAALYISPEHAYLFNFRQEAPPNYTGEALCHMICALFGLYLILTNQVKCDFKHWLKAIKFLYPILIGGVIYNYIFHDRLFGMNPYGNYSIYMIDIFGTFSATLAAYLIGVLVVLTLGLQSGHLLTIMLTSRKPKLAEEAASHETENVDISSETAVSEESPTTEVCPTEATDELSTENGENETDKEEGKI